MVGVWRHPRQAERDLPRCIRVPSFGPGDTVCHWPPMRSAGIEYTHMVFRTQNFILRQVSVSGRSLPVTASVAGWYVERSFFCLEVVHLHIRQLKKKAKWGYITE